MAPEPFDGYIRISRVGGREGASFISPDVQRQTIKRLAQAHGLKLGEVIEEFDVSGGKPIDDRELGRLVRKVEGGESGGLIVWKLSRFSRNLLDGVTVADRIRRADGRLIAEDFDSDQAMGQAILGFLLGWAEEELNARRAGWREAQRRAAERGVFPSRTPLGYGRIEEEVEKGRLVPDPETAPIVTEIFRMRAAGASLGACADRLHQAVPGRGWSRAAMKQLLASPVYLGKIVHGDNLYVEHAHEALIDERTWQLAQRDGLRTPRTGSTAGKGVLRGLIRCEACGNPLTVVASGAPGERVASYTCRKKRASGICTAPATARIDAVDALVLPVLEARADGVDLEAALGELHDAQVAFAEADRELEEFLAGARISDLGAEVYNREVARRRETLRQAATGYREALDAQDAMASASDDDMTERRELARRLIDSVTLRQSIRGRWEPIADRVRIQWR